MKEQNQEGSLLQEAVLALWPSRKKRELLFDLGERKNWKEEEFRQACAKCLSWWVAQRLIEEPTLVEAPLIRRASPKAREIKAQASWLSNITALPTLVGSSTKTLENTLSKGFQSKRPSHLWMATLANAREQAPLEDSVLYHQRTAAGATRAWQRLRKNAEAGTLDAWDALHLFTLIGLYQRRRDKKEARGNRGQEATRRDTPKPISDLIELVLKPRQANFLLKACSQSNTPGARALGFLVMEWRLTDAYLTTHQARRSQAVNSNPQLWKQLEGLLSLKGDLFGEHRSLFQYRIDKMCRYENQKAKLEARSLPENSKYVEVSEVTEEIYRRGPEPALVERFKSFKALIEQDAPGIFMLRPQLLDWFRRLEQ